MCTVEHIAVSIVIIIHHLVVGIITAHQRIIIQIVGVAVGIVVRHHITVAVNVQFENAFKTFDIRQFVLRGIAQPVRR